MTEKSGVITKFSNIIIFVLSIVVIILIVFMVRKITQISTTEPISGLPTMSGSVAPNSPASASLDSLSQQAVVDTQSPVTVEILNGIGQPGLAYRIRNHLINAYAGKIDVYKYENATSFNYNHTLLIDRRLPFDGEDTKIMQLKSWTGISVVVNQRFESGVDASIVIGQDWARYFPEVAKELGY